MPQNAPFHGNCFMLGAETPRWVTSSTCPCRTTSLLFSKSWMPCSLKLYISTGVCVCSLWAPIVDKETTIKFVLVVYDRLPCIHTHTPVL